jgi:hypothetical protein
MTAYLIMPIPGVRVFHVLRGIWQNRISILVSIRRLSMVDFSLLDFATSFSAPIRLADLFTEFTVSPAQRLMRAQAPLAVESLPTPKAGEFVHGE